MGVGSGGFKSFAPMHGLVEFMRADRHAGHDLADYLCEHGLIGCGLVAIAVGTIMFGYARRIALLPQVPNGFGTLPDRCLLFRMTPMAVVLSSGSLDHTLSTLPIGSVVTPLKAKAAPPCVTSSTRIRSGHQKVSHASRNRSL
jgi:hypothetical protein